MGQRYSWGRGRILFLRQLLAIILTLSFSFSPLLTFAQEVGSDTPPADIGASTTPTATNTQTPPSDFSIPGVGPPNDASTGVQTKQVPSDTLGTTDTTNSGNQSLQPLAPPPVSPPPPQPSIQSASVFTLQNERPKADGQSGALLQNLKLDIPSGRNGLQPDLSLKYNSQSAEDGIAGYGWTVTVPYIQRLNKLGSQNLYNAPRFTSSIDGELATTSSATTTQTFGAKVDSGTFNSYSITNNVWTMYDKHGTRYLFGASDNSQQNASASSTQIYTWYLQEIRDTNNNYVRYVYAKDSGQLYPLAIYYTGNGMTDGIFKISFSTSTRLDPYISYKPLFKVTTNYRISRITAAINGTTVREYDLSYTAGNNGMRSLLSSFQESGWDANGNNEVTLPPEAFSYVNDSSGGFFGRPPGGGHIKSQSYVVADIGGNAKPDVTVSYNTPPAAAFTLPDGGTQVSLTTGPGYWAAPVSTCHSYDPSELGERLLDTNADGKADDIYGFYNYTTGVTTVGASMNTYSTSTGYAWSGTATGTVPAFGSDGSGSIHGETTGIFGDVNGDGLPDFEEAVGSWGGVSPALGDYAYLGNGSLWDPATTTVFAPMKELPIGTPTVTNSQLIDVNGDGLADWVYSDSGNTYVLLNTGTGWESTPSSQWTIATSTLYLVPGSSPAQYLDRGVRFIDVNGDGLPDFVRSFKNTAASNPNDEVADYNIVLLNTGSGWATSTPASYGMSGYITQGDATAGQCFDEYATNWDGIGQNKQDVISTITYPQGGTASISYVKTAASGNPELPISLLVVSKMITNDGLGNTNENDYTYSNGKIYTALGVREQKFAGFASTAESDANTSITTYYDQGDGISTGNGEQKDGYGQIGHPYRIDTTDVTSGKLLRSVFNRWDTSTSSSPTGNITFAYLARQVTQDYGPSGAHRDSAVDYSYDPTTGNVKQISRYGEVIGNSDGTFSDTGSDKSTETLLYVGSSSGTTGSSTSQTFASSTTWTAPAGVTSVTVDIWGGGGGGSDDGGDGGPASYVHATGVSLTPGNMYAVTVAVGGGGGGNSSGGTGGSGYAHGGAGAAATNDDGGGGGGSSAFANDGPSVIAAGGAGGANCVGTGVTGTSGGAACSTGNSLFGGAGGGAAATNGGNASGFAGGGAGLNATAMTGTPGAMDVTGAGSSAAGASGNGNVGSFGSSGHGGNGSGGASGGSNGSPGQPGTVGTSTDSGGGGGLGLVNQNGGAGAAPGGGGAQGQVSPGSGHGGNGGIGEVVLTFASSSSATSSAIKDAVYDDLVVDQSSSTVRETRHYYDGLTLGNVSVGNETKTENWISGTSSATYASTTQVFDGTYGLVTQSRDADGNLSTSTLDANNLYEATTTNALFKTTGNTYDYSTGKIKTTFDSNNRLFSTAYDAFGRPLTIGEPDPANGGSTVTKTTYAYTDSSTPGSTSILETDYLSSATSSTLYKYVDGLGRDLQARKLAKGNNNYSAKDWMYNNVGLLKSESLLYLASSSARSSATSTTNLFTTFTYDGLQRIKAIVNSVGTTSNAYDRWTVTTKDPNGNLKDYTKDAYGNLATVAEYYATSSATTTYAWDLNRSLTKITDASGNIRSFTYDGLGGRLTAQDLHAVADGTFGTWTYAYDTAGNLASTTDAKGQTVSYAYDALNRKLTEDYGGQTGVEVTYTYDTCANGVGRLCVASSTSAKYSGSYDPDGNVSNATTTISGTAYGTSYAYDRHGNLTNVVYPNNAQVNYSLNSADLTDTIAYKPSGGSFANLVNDFEYAPDARVTSQADHNGVTTTLTYDPNAQYRLTRILSCGTPCNTAASQASQTFTSSGTFTAPTGVTSVTVDMWGGGGGGGTGAPGGAGAYLHTTVSVTPGNNYTATIAGGGSPGLNSTTAGTGGAGYKTGGNGSNGSTGSSGGGGGGSSAFAYDGGTLIAAGGGGGGFNVSSGPVNPSGTSGGTGAAGVGSLAGAGGGGAAGTNGGNASGATGGAAGTGATSMTGTTPVPLNEGGPSSAGSSANGSQTGTRTGANGSGGAAGGASGGGNGADGAGTDSGGGGGGTASGSPGNGGRPGGGGGSSESTSISSGGTGGGGKVVVTYGTSTGSTVTALQDLNYMYDNIGNITQIKNIGSSTASTTVHLTYDTLNRLTNAYTKVGPGITIIPHNYWTMNGTSSDSVGGLNGFDTAMSYSTTTGVLAQGGAFNGSTSKIDIGTIASGTINLSVGAWIKTTSSNEEWIIGQDNVGVVNGQWHLGVLNGKVIFYTQASGGGGNGGSFYGNISVNDGNWHYVGASQLGPTYAIYVDGVLDVQTTVGTPVSYDPTVSSGIGYDRRDNSNYFNGNIDEVGVWYAPLSNMDFLTLYNAGKGYAYPFGSSTLASTTYSAQYYSYDALGNLVSKSANKYSYAATGYANPDATTQIANGISTTTYGYDNNGNLTSAGTSTFSWDYNNRMTQAVTQGSTSTYSYDYAGNRVSQVAGSATTVYPNKYFSVTSSVSGATTTATTTVYVWNGDTLIATIDQVTVNGSNIGSSSTRYIHPDNLGSTNIVTDESGNIVADYETYPYGETRINQTMYPTKENRRFIGQFSDANNLQYLNARYLNSQQGQFLSEDPVFLMLGDANQVQQMTQQDQNKFLSDPQQLNAYSYGRDNPIINKDASGNQVVPLLLLGLEAYGGIQLTFDAVDIAQTNFIYGDVFTPEEKSQSVFKGGFDAATTIIGGSAARVGLADAGRALSVLGAGGDALDQFSGKQIYGPDNALHRDKKGNYQSINLVQAMGGSGSATSLTTFTSRSTTAGQSGQSNVHSSGGGASSASYGQFISNLSQFVSSLSSYLAVSGNKPNTK